LLHLQQVSEGTSGPFSARQPRSDQGRDRGRVSLVDVLFARPEEPAQSILATTRDNMRVKMRDALTHDVVDRDKRSIGGQRERQRGRDSLYQSEKWRDGIDWKVGKGRNVVDRYDENVTLEQWRAIEERHRPLVAIDEVGVASASDDFAEYA